MAKHDPQQHPCIVFKASKIHGTGGFARVDLQGGKRIIEYVGRKISTAEGQAELRKQNVYIFTLDDAVDIDGSVDWNPARFLNHSCDPNCEAEVGQGHIWIRTLRRVKAGAELTYNYSHELEGYQDRPCRCGAINCVGYIVAEEHFDTISDRV